MKRYLLLAVLFSIAIPCTEAVAQQLVPFAGGGIAMGTGDLGDDTESGWFVLGGLDFTLPAIDDGFAVGVVASHARISYEGEFDETAQLTVISGELSYLVGIGMVRPYIRGGGGVQIHKYDPGDINARSSTNTSAAFTAGAGINVRLGGADLVLGGRFATGSGGGFLGFHGGFAIPLRAGR